MSIYVRLATDRTELSTPCGPCGPAPSPTFTAPIPAPVLDRIMGSIIPQYWTVSWAVSCPSTGLYHGQYHAQVLDCIMGSIMPKYWTVSLAVLCPCRACTLFVSCPITQLYHVWYHVRYHAPVLRCIISGIMPQYSAVSCVINDIVCNI